MGVVVPFIGNWVGVLLENAVGAPFCSWEMALLAVLSFTAPGGVLVGLLGVLSRRWSFGLGIGAILHAIPFAFIVAIGDAPETVLYWMLTVGIITGGIAGAIGGALYQVANRLEAGREISTA